MRVLRSSTSFFLFFFFFIFSFTPFIHVACYVRGHIVLCAFTRICALASHAIAPERQERFVIQLCKRGDSRERIESGAFLSPADKDSRLSLPPHRGARQVSADNALQSICCTLLIFIANGASLMTDALFLLPWSK